MIKGSKHRPEIIAKIKARMKKGSQGFRKTIFKKGHKTKNPWWKNPEHRIAASERMFKLKWCGDKVGIGGIHDWLKREYGKADRCENINCNKKSKLFHWAKLKSKPYKRRRDHFWQLCMSCHKKYDIGKNPL